MLPTKENQRSSNSRRRRNHHRSLSNRKWHKPKSSIHVNIMSSHGKSLKKNTLSTTRQSFSHSNDILCVDKVTDEDKKSNINDHHNLRSKKKKIQWRKLICIISTVFAVLIAIIALSVVLFIILNKPKAVNKRSGEAILRWNRTGITVAGTTNSPGTTSYQLNGNWFLYFDWMHTLYVSDVSNNRVQAFERGSMNGKTIAGQSNGNPGSNLNGLNNPRGLFVKDNGDLYVADGVNNRIQMWRNGSTQGVTIAGTGISGTQLNWPFGLVFDPNSQSIYVSEHNNNRVVRFIDGSPNGTIVAGGNGQGGNSNQLYYPHGIDFNAFNNSLLIANRPMNNVVRWNLGASNWTLVAGSPSGTAGSSSSLLFNPTDVKCDPMGNIYVVERDNHRVQLFLPGEFVGTTIAGVTSVSGSNATLLKSPQSIQFDNQLNLYVSDMLNHRVQKFPRY